MFFSIILLAISVSIDALGIGLTYGIKNTKISIIANILLFCISFSIVSMSVYIGNILEKIIPLVYCNIIGNLILIFMGIFMIYQATTKKNSSKKYKIGKEKNLSFFIKSLGITINIIKNPISSDLDNSKFIDAKEAFFLGLALSLDAFCIGIGSKIMGISSALFPLLVASFQLCFLKIGSFIGLKLNNKSSIPENIWSLISGFILIFIGILKFF